MNAAFASMRSAGIGIAETEISTPVDDCRPPWMVMLALFGSRVRMLSCAHVEHRRRHFDRAAGERALDAALPGASGRQVEPALVCEMIGTVDTGATADVTCAKSWSARRQIDDDAEAAGRRLEDAFERVCVAGVEVVDTPIDVEPIESSATDHA